MKLFRVHIRWTAQRWATREAMRARFGAKVRRDGTTKLIVCAANEHAARGMAESWIDDARKAPSAATYFRAARTEAIPETVQVTDVWVLSEEDGMVVIS